MADEATAARWARVLRYDPYPEAVFTELTDHERAAINWAIRDSGVRQAVDRWHASWARQVLANLRAALLVDEEED